MWSIGIFLFSLLGLVGLISLSVWEGRRGHKLFSTHRAKLDALALKAASRAARSVPTFDQRLFHEAYHATLHLFALVVLRIVRAVERRAVKILDTVRGRRTFPVGGSQSAFLRRVSEHKERLGREAERALE